MMRSCSKVNALPVTRSGVIRMTVSVCSVGRFVGSELPNLIGIGG